MSIISRYLDGLVDPMFSTDDQGRRTFYPFGVLGRGRILPDAARAEALRRRARIVTGCVFAIIIPAIAISGSTGWTLNSFAVLMICAVAVGLAQSLYLRSLVSDLPVSETRLKLASAWRAQASSLGRGWLRALFGVSAIFVVTGLAIAIFDRDMILLGLASVAMFGPCAVLFWRQLRSLDNTAGAPQSR